MRGCELRTSEGEGRAGRGRWLIARPRTATWAAAVAKGGGIARGGLPRLVALAGFDLEYGVTESTTAFASAWSGLWRQIACQPNFEASLKRRIVLDLMNEPDVLGMR